MSIPENAIAVVGMAGRFPGAKDVSAFWSNLRRGKESIVTLSEQELRDAGVSDKTLADPAYVRRAPLLDGIDEFDAGFFGFPPLAAQVLDPQHRLFLQCAWHALEDAGADPARFDGSIGVYGTSSPSGYLLHNLLSHRDPNAVLAEGLNFDQFSLFLQNDKDFLATRISHAFNLRGPSIAVQTACSSSLVAVHLACLSLLSGECDMALAGGSSLCIPHRVGYFTSPGSMVSAVGHCRPFDVRADGTVFGSGVGLVVLKPLAAAIDAGDRIHAVIRGSAINNDGSAKMGYAAPNPAAQADVIAEAHAVSGIDSSTVSYVECHGTGTPLGDPIEIQGLRAAFEVSQTSRSAPCVLGSVKSNIGHLEVAAGIAGLIKTILCLKNKALPATLHYTSPNPELRLDQSPFVVQSKYGPLGVRRRSSCRGEFVRGRGYQRARRLGGGASRSIGGFSARRAGWPSGNPALGANGRGARRVADRPGRGARNARRPAPVRRGLHARPAPQAQRHDGRRRARPRARGHRAAGGRARQRFRWRSRPRWGAWRSRRRRTHVGSRRFPVSRTGRSARRNGKRAL